MKQTILARLILGITVTTLVVCNPFDKYSLLVNAQTQTNIPTNNILQQLFPSTPNQLSPSTFSEIPSFIKKKLESEGALSEEKILDDSLFPFFALAYGYGIEETRSLSQIGTSPIKEHISNIEVDLKEKLWRDISKYLEYQALELGALTVAHVSESVSIILRDYAMPLAQYGINDVPANRNPDSEPRYQLKLGD